MPANEIERLTEERDEALRRLNARAAFLAQVSHDLRDPMSGVVGVAKELKETPLDDEQKAWVDNVISSAQDLITLVNDILDQSRIDAGKPLALHPTDFALSAACEGWKEGYRLRARDKGIGFALNLAPDLPERVHGDPGRVRRIVDNLVGNALKFTAQGTVTLDVKPGPVAEDGRINVVIEVRDQGPGIDPAAAERLFNPYEQADASIPRKFGGAGLGLAIARQLAELMGGDLKAVPRDGPGACFVAELVFDPPKQVGTAAKGDLGGVKLLVVDPTARSRDTLIKQAASWGMKAAGAESFESAHAALLEAAASDERFGLVVIERRAQGDEAERLAAWIRSSGDHPDAKLVLLTASGVRGDAYRASEAGFDAYLPSPATPSTLLECFQRLQAGAGEGLVTAHSLAEGRGPKRKVLYADDNPVNRRVVQSMLQRAGHAIRVVGDGQAALEALDAEPFDLVLMDVQMPVMDGLEAAKAIRARNDERKNVPIIAVTANAMSKDRDDCLAAGMNDHLPKPIDRARLNTLLERCAA